MNESNDLSLYTPHWVLKDKEKVTEEKKFDRQLILVSEQLTQDLSNLSEQGVLKINSTNCILLKDKHLVFPSEDYIKHTQWLFSIINKEIKQVGNSLIQIVLPFHFTEYLTTLYLGLLRTIEIESSIYGQIIFVNKSLNQSTIINACLKESLVLDNQMIRLTDGKRECYEFDLLNFELMDKKPLVPWQQNGIYLITGGLGGIGKILASDVISHIQSGVLVLLGRAPKLQKENELMALQQLVNKSHSTLKIHYFQVDINDASALSTCLKTIKLKKRHLNGILHCAGEIKDGYLINKNQLEIKQVLAPKIKGVQNLHELTQTEKLDFFISFSSLASITGNIGQADYAFANGYLDSFNQWRCRQVRQGQAYGQSLVINWPLWADGGMTISHDAAVRLNKQSGIVAIDKNNALRALYLAIQSNKKQVAVAYGDRNKLHKHITKRNLEFPKHKNKIDDIKGNKMSTINNPTLSNKLIKALKGVFSQYTDITIEYLDADERFEMYGIDSIMVARLNDKIDEHYSDVPKSIFYQCRTIRALSDYLAKYHKQASMEWVGNILQQVNHQPIISSETESTKKTNQSYEIDERGSNKSIAIIGMSGRFPKAENIDVFWDNLVTGKNCIGEIPSDRWSLENFYIKDKEQAVQQGKSYSKWGGFLEGFADFDPLFFNISPKESLDLDPQERLFLENCYCTLEHAGLTKKDLHKKYQGDVGVFVGITKTGFERYSHDLDRAGSTCKPRTSFSSVANRVSYFFDLNGPSLPVDTMCSSSLTAIHQACESLYKGECKLALAGGVNLYQHPQNYYDLCASGMLSEEGLCRSFGEGGTGFVPGEGVASLLLKPLSEAQKDGDNIVAIIRSSAINHGGHTQGFTVPNPQAQSQLIQTVLSNANISCDEVSYVEAHGTGTQLGDPIEFDGLNKVFQPETGRSNKCNLGSVKSNIGHLEAAAGVTGLIKTVLQMQHQQLVSSLHATQENRHIDFKNSSFALLQKNKHWQVPKNQLRAAMVSSFGAGGSNASVLIEEYPEIKDAQDSCPTPDKYAIIFSARTKPELEKVVSNHLKWLKDQLQSVSGSKQFDNQKEIQNKLLSIVSEQTQISLDDLNISMDIAEFDFGLIELQNLYTAFEKEFELSDISNEIFQSKTLLDWIDLIDKSSIKNNLSNTKEIDLLNMAYTLQTGREAMVFRLALCVESSSELEALLSAYLNNDLSEQPLLYFEEVIAKKETLSQLESSTDIKALLNRWLKEEDYSSILPLWVKGLSIDWQNVYTKQQRKFLRVLDLPSYPFTKKRLWPIDILSKKIINKNNLNRQKQEAIEETQKNIPEIITVCLEKSLMLDKQNINPNQAFSDLGLDSILSVGLVKQLNESLSINLQTAALFDYPCVNQLADYIETEYDVKLSVINNEYQETEIKTKVVTNDLAEITQASNQQSDIAIIGMSGCFPGAENIDQLWEEISAGHNHITQAERWPLDAQSNACTKGGFLNDIDQFDAMFFNISGVEASHMDPQQRIFLQQVWTTLEDAGYAGNALSGKNCGVYVGCCNGDYQDLFSQEPTAQSLWGNMGSVIPSRIAYLLDLKGPALAIDTSCSSSLVAIHTACQDLRRGDTNFAIAGGVFVQSTAKLYLSANKANMLSPTGETSSFDYRADGFVPGEAAGALLLKRLDDAISDGDHIHAVIKGSGLNNDGATNGITAPSAVSQEALLSEVYAKYNINLEDIDYIETHGTGTQLGDPIEFRALQGAFKSVLKKQQCTLGSIKQNIGHTQFAAGVSGIIKVVLSLKNNVIPASINFKKANKDVPLFDSPFKVNTNPQSWKTTEGKTRLAGVSSFGASGTNAHIVIAESPIKITRRTSKHPVLVVLSARSSEALKNNTVKLHRFCQKHSELDPRDISFTLLAGRGHFENRLALIVKDMDDLILQLSHYIQYSDGENFSLKTIYNTYVKTPANTIDKSIDIPSLNDDSVYETVLHKLALRFSEGAAINYNKLFEGQRVNRIPLPTYSFSKDQYWTNKTPNNVKQTIPLFTLTETSDGYKVQFKNNAYVFEQHKIKGQSVLPGVMIVELLRVALSLKSPEVKNWALKNLVWVNPVIREYKDDLHLKISKKTDTDQFSFEFTTNTKATPESLVLSRGSIDYLMDTTDDSRLDLQAIQKLSRHSQWTAKQCYDLTQQQGLFHGQMMRALKQVSVYEDYAIAQLQLPTTSDQESQHMIQPCIVDSLILMSVAFLLDQNIDVYRVTNIPFMVDKFEILGDLSTVMWAKMQLPILNSQGFSGAINADLFDDKGKLCIRMEGCFYRPSKLKKQAELFIPSWKKINIGVSNQKSLLDNKMVWLMSTNGELLPDLLNHFPTNNVINVDTSKTQLAHYLRGGSVPLQIILLALPSTPTEITSELISKQNEIVLAVLRLIKMMVALELDAHKIQWTVITEQTQTLLNDRITNPIAAGLHGLIGSMTKEFSLWSSRIVDVTLFSKNVISDISALPISANSCSLALRNGAWYQSELVPYHVKKQPISKHYKTNGNYLVIGGAGGVGRVWSKMLAKTYQAQLIWVGRRTINDKISGYIDEIAAYGPRPIYIQADASNYSELLACSQQIQQQLGRLNGIVHSAISLNDQSILKMDREQFIKASKSKVDISVYLTQCFDLAAMDFVLFFSSIQSFAKMPGQSNYASGCTFEDSYSHYLVSKGINAKTINWGYWAEIGVVATELVEQRMKKLGLLSLSENDLKSGLDYLLACETPQLAMVALTEDGSVETLTEQYHYLQSDQAYDSIFNTVVAQIPDQQLIIDEISSIVGDQMSAFDEEMAQLLFVQLSEAGLFNQNTTSINEIKSKINPLYGQWIEESLRVLVKHQYLQWTSDHQLDVSTIKSRVSSTKAWQDWTHKTKPLLNNPDIQSHIILAETMLFALSEVIVGSTSATEIMFPESSLRLVEGVYRDNRVADYFNQVLCESLVISVRKHLEIDPNKKIRILEVGSGTGGTAKRVFAALKPFKEHIAEYCYTDLSKAFLIHAEKNYRDDAPYLRTCIFNADKTVTEQGIDKASYDIVIATNVIHATQNIRRSLKHIKEALLTNGLFLLNELNDNVLFSHLTFGLLEGWWNYNDPELRITGSPALNKESWTQVLAEEGFTKIAFPADKAHHLGQQLIIAESNGLIKQSNNLQIKNKADVTITAEAPINKTPNREGNRLKVSPNHINKQQVIQFLRHIVSSTIEIPADKIESNVSFERYGVDSLLVLQLINELRVYFSPISSVLLFEVNTLELLSDYLIKNNHQQLFDALGISKQQNSEYIKDEIDPGDFNKTVLDEPEHKVNKGHKNTADIAIVGMSARFADADNLEQFWENISSSKDSIRTISQNRADWQSYKDFNKAGFLNGIDEFDPLFFHLSPAEAEQMDPQERLFIQEAYHCIEEAGYAPLSIGSENKVGVYVGIMNSHYAEHSAFWSVANRVSFLLDLKGPSMAIDTACSSSLTAVHLAVESLRSGSADMVIAGGVNLIVNPQHMEILDNMSLLSPEAKCKAFGQGGNGIAIGEGVGALLLRPLKDALKNNDHIHGIIKGTALNSGGRSSSYTAPKASAQAQLLKDAWQNANVQASDISYIEGHGTGTELGDPIEFEGLNLAFEKQDKTRQSCVLGSVKTNVGHLESAAGIAGVCKVILQMQHQQIAPSLYCDEINPHIDIKYSPFEMAKGLQQWQRNSDSPYLAGVNSFGAGGSNAHVVLKEYQNKEQTLDSQLLGQQIIVLSAQSIQQLKKLSSQLHEYLVRQKISSVAGQANYLANIAWTLQTGRDAMLYRLAFVCDDLDHLMTNLSGYIAGRKDSLNTIKSDVAVENTLEADEAIDSLIKTWVQRGKIGNIAKLWVKGYSISWAILFNNIKPQKISLPVYPFVKGQYWIQNVTTDHTIQTLKLQDVEAKLEIEEQTVAIPVIEYLRESVSDLLKLPLEDVFEAEPLENYGLDSGMIIRLIDRLESRFGELSKTLFFEYPTLADLADFLAKKDKQSLLTKNEFKTEKSVVNNESHTEKPAANNESNLTEDIAIIGIAGRYPDAENLDQFWDNLSQAKDSVTTVPTERWKSNGHFSGATQKGGFIKNVEHFDAVFFNMLPADAELSDPQERLFVETVYHAIENSGYTYKNLTENNVDESVGVYVGVMYEDYQLHGVEVSQKGQQMALSGSPASIANRVSYLFDFNGPSLAIDSMCSSSFSAIHLACQAIKHGDCSIAIAGGVNLTLHENKFRMLNIGGFSSRNGHCAAFGESGDGYVPSEGVGAVILKPLSLAKKDGDAIIGVIKATAINHGGKSNGYTVPNAQSQASVIRSALSKSTIKAEDINYIEAHGTGTVLGDPIEIEGLMQSYGLQAGTGDCAIGSVKSNIGHCESAAGMASLSKVLLQIKHQQIVPSLFSQPRNPHIDFDSTPFDVQSNLAQWMPLYSQEGIVKPLRAGINSFGAGGVNSHIIIEQFIDDRNKTKKKIPKSSLIVLSARTEKALSQIMINLYDQMNDEKEKITPINNIAFTLQSGREAMSNRLAFVVDSYQQCLTTLEALINHTQNNIQVHQGQVLRWKKHDQVQKLEDFSLNQLASRWVKGDDILWKNLYLDDVPQRVALPAYPFERKAYWAPQKDDSEQENTTEKQHELLFIKPTWLEQKVEISKLRSVHHVILLSDSFDELANQLKTQTEINQVDLLAFKPDFIASALRLINELKLLIESDHLKDAIVQVVVSNTIENAPFLSLVALVKSLNQENSQIHFQVVALDVKNHPNNHEILMLEAQSDEDIVRYQPQREIKRLQHCDLIPLSETHLWEAGQVFLISGGAGGLGWIYTQAIANQVRQAKLVLLGRSKLSQDRLDEINQLNKLGVSIIYYAVDVIDKNSLVTIVDKAIRQWGGIDHVIHSAGVLRDGYLMNKSEADISSVLTPKIVGVEVLDKVTKNESLSSFICFSSIAGVTGNAGQSDYSMANGYLDGFAQDRNSRVKEGQCSGQTLSINWSLWKEGGMQMEPFSEQLMLRNYGLAAIPSHIGVTATQQAYTLLNDQIMIAYGDIETIFKKLDNGILTKEKFDFNSEQKDDMNDAKLATDPIIDIENKILLLVAEILRVTKDEVDVSLPLGEYGFDSISFTQLAANISELFNVTVQPSDIFSYPTIAALSNFISPQNVTTPQTVKLNVPLHENLCDHPLIDKQISRCLFSVNLSSDEELLTDHRINNDKVFPGTAYIEMALAALTIIDKTNVFSIENIHWKHICVVNNPKELLIDFDNDYSLFSIYSNEGGKKIVYASGEVTTIDSHQVPTETISINTGGLTQLPAESCYKAFKSIGVEYGESHQCIKSISLMNNGVIAELHRHEASDNKQWILNPMYLDSVLQTSIALMANEKGKLELTGTEVPFSLQSIVIAGPLPNKIWVKVVKQKSTIDFIICDQKGQVCGKLLGLKSYPIGLNKKTPNKEAPIIENTAQKKVSQKDAVAIIGMSGSFPQAENLDEFWNNLLYGKDSIVEVPADRWDWKAIFGDPLLKEGCTNIKWGGFMDNMSHFDYSFFGISSKEAEILDPQQRLLMMHVWKAIEDAGYAPSSLAGSNTGLIIATVAIDYAFRLDQAKQAIGGRTALGNVASVGPNRMSYLLDIHGPSETVETACSSSLVALHRGVQVIQSGESDMVIVGGINTISTAKGHVGFSQSGMLSPTGRCHSFSEDADGYVRGEGVGMLVLKSLSAAEAAGDPIHGVILGSGVNHGGKANSLTSPNPKAQSQLISSVMKKANINPQSMSFIESHGTGTRLGDPIEIDALKQAYQSIYESCDESFNGKQPHIAIGALKSHIGHLEMASGIAGVIKVLLQMRHKTLVGNLHCEKVNTYINMAKTPFYLNNQTRPWVAPFVENNKQEKWPLRAGVSSFGFGGVNAHVIIENYQPTMRHLDVVRQIKPELFILSAKSASSLINICYQLLQWVDLNRDSKNSAISLENIAWTLQTGRDEMPYRLAFIVSDFGEIKQTLQNYINGERKKELYTGVVDIKKKHVTQSKVMIKNHLETVSELSKNPVLNTIAKEWVKGVVFDWNDLSQSSRLQTIHLPSYVFDGHKCWVDVVTETLKDVVVNEPLKVVALDQSLLFILADELGIESDQINISERFDSLGVDSIAKLQLVSRFNQQNLGVLTKDHSDYLLQTETLADCLHYLKSIEIEKPNKVLNEQNLIYLLADYFDIDSESLNINSNLNDFGIDSIGFIRLIAYLTEYYPTYDLDKKSDQLLLSKNIQELFKVIKYQINESSTIRTKVKIIDDSVSILPTTKKIESTAKNNPINHVVDRIEGTREGKVFSVGLLKVDESHPFFFDHPLDHVSGMHLAQAMSDVTKSSYLYHYGLPQDSELLIYDLILNFPNSCNKSDETKVVSRLLKSDDKGDYYDAQVTQNGKIVAEAKLAIKTVTPNSINSSEIAIDINRLVIPELVNKQKQENVLISELAQYKKQMRCEIILHPDAIYYQDFNGQHLDSIVVAEAVRQCLRLAIPKYYPDFIAKFEFNTEQLHSFLKDIKLSLLAPIYKDKQVEIEIKFCNLSETGSAKYFELSGDILYDNELNGSFSISALMMSDSLLKNWTKTN